ncbi:unnamed protein product [Amoebophrya sp. A120]|nr:unnamed protein product [Amoebophrya sp. A120]|eukprot:GSA120T00015625001.1
MSPRGERTAAAGGSANFTYGSVKVGGSRSSRASGSGQHQKRPEGSANQATPSSLSAQGSGIMRSGVVGSAAARDSVDAGAGCCPCLCGGASVPSKKDELARLAAMNTSRVGAPVAAVKQSYSAMPVGQAAPQVGSGSVIAYPNAAELATPNKQPGSAPGSAAANAGGGPSSTNPGSGPVFINKDPPKGATPGSPHTSAFPNSVATSNKQPNSNYVMPSNYSPPQSSVKSGDSFLSLSSKNNAPPTVYQPVAFPGHEENRESEGSREFPRSDLFDPGSQIKGPGSMAAQPSSTREAANEMKKSQIMLKAQPSGLPAGGAAANKSVGGGGAQTQPSSNFKQEDFLTTTEEDSDD